jgi:beta-phosphoglucomutase-like phosphatase (HAD superfamily)
MKIKAVIWDFDGVLIDSEPHHIEAETETLKHFGFRLTRSVALEYLGVKLEDYFSDIADRFNINASVDEMISSHYNTLIRYYREVFPLVPHAVEVLEELKSGYIMSVATSREKQLARLAMERFSLLKYFGSVVYGDDVKQGKPDPEPFLTVAKQMDVSPESAVVVEDSSSGVKAAIDAGMIVIVRLASYNRDLDFSSSDYTVEDLREIPPLLKQINRRAK